MADISSLIEPEIGNNAIWKPQPRTKHEPIVDMHDKFPDGNLKG